MSLLRCVGRQFLLSRQSLRAISTAQVCCYKPHINAAEKIIDDPIKSLQDGTNHRVDALEKQFLVWSGKFKSVDDVPPTVPHDKMEKARNIVRIKIANYMMLATVVACIAFIYNGKQALKNGKSVQKMNLDWHKEINEKTNK